MAAASASKMLLVLVFFVLSLAVTSTASARTLTVPVGSEATWVELDSGEHLAKGRSLGRVVVDARRIRAHCRRQDEDFSGYIQLVRTRQASGRTIEFRCLKRAADDQASATEKPA